MQEFLSRARWDADLVRDDLQAYAIEHLGDDQAVLVLDETGFLKKGIKSAGVQRQYSGTAGRIENSQIGVFLGYASRHGHTLIDRALYLPESWTEDRARCAEACIPASVGFATKPALGRNMLTRAFAAGIPCAWVTGDCVYGGDHRLRRLIEEHGRGYVLAVRNNQCFEQKLVTRLAKRLTAKDWHRHSAGDGAKGPRLYDWALIPAKKTAADGWRQGLLIRRAVTDRSDLAFYLIHAPTAASLADLVQVAGRRWTIETCFEAAKSDVGLDQYEVRSWVGWHRHITLAMLAHAYLTVLCKAAAGGRSERRSAGRTPPPDRTRTPPPSLAAGLDATTRSKHRHRLVELAKTTSATRKEMSLENS
jgi:SRSO17 transposase